MTSLRQTLDKTRGVGPGFHWLRHALAIGIIAHHCRAAVYFSASALAEHGAMEGIDTALPSGQHLSLEDIVRPALFSLVGMFFALSGFLVTGSAFRNSDVRIFFVNRALRIIPALSVEVTLSALVLGPLVTSLGLLDYLSDPRFFRYFGNIVGHVTFFLPGVFQDNPWPNIVNGNLWTLQPEFWCYALMMLAMVTGVLRRRLMLACALIAVLLAAAVADAGHIGFANVMLRNQYTTWYVTAMFCIGVTAYLFADRIIIDYRIFIASAVCFWVSIVLHVVPALSGVFLCYCMLYLGMLDWKWWNRTVRADHSYGIYLYGFPIMQTIVHFALPYVENWQRPAQTAALFMATLLITLCFAEFSWRLVERPALGLRYKFARPKAPAATPVS